MSPETGEARIKRLQPRDPIGDVGPALLDEPRQVGCHVGAVSCMTPAGNPRGVLERNIEAAEVDEEPEMLDVLVAVLSIVIVPTGRRR